MWQRLMSRMVCAISVVRDVVVRALVAGCASALMAAGAFAQDPIPGSLQTPGFANGYFPVGAGTDVATAVALQHDGKIVLAGYCFSGSNDDFCVARLNPDGTLDASFDGPAGNGNGKFLLSIGLSGEARSASAVVIQPDGKIVLAGYCYVTGYDFCIARLSPDGTPDVSFDGPSGTGNGMVVLPIGAGHDRAAALALQPDGKIVLAGYCFNGSNDDFCVARLNPDGTLDVSFDGPAGNGNGKFLLPIGTSDDFANALLIQSDGKIVLAGYCENGGFDFCVARMNPDGTLDVNFDGHSGASNGKFLLPIGTSNDYAYAVALQPDGKIVLAGNCSNGSNNDFCVARLNPDGTLDESFDGPNTAGGKFFVPISVGNDNAKSLALQPDGKIVLAGQCDTGGSASFCLARLHSDGSLDTSFDGSSSPGNGKFLLSMSSGDSVNALVLQPDGRIVLAGVCTTGFNSDFCVARLNGGPHGAQHCKPDLDGDGRMLATVDGLISTRVMLGLTGSAVIGGIAFAPHATRNTWPLIRNYLVTQCGMTLAP